MSFKSTLRVFLAGLVALVLAFPASAAGLRIVGLGDSLMAGYMLGPDESFPARLQIALSERGHDVVVEGAGVSGDTSSGGLARLDWSVPDGTDIVILELGANDMLRGIEPAITRRNLDEMIARLKERGIRILLAGMRAAPNLGPDYQREFDAIYPELAGKHGLDFYPFFLDGVAAERALLLDDGMHPNPAGIDRIVEGILPALEAMLGK